MIRRFTHHVSRRPAKTIRKRLIALHQIDLGALELPQLSCHLFKMPSLLSTVVNRFTSSDKSQDASPKHSVVAEKRKAPPPESPENVRQRTKVILSFWAVALLIGVPLWWTTTSIYRAPLPLAEMQNWSEGKVHLPFPLSFMCKPDENRNVKQNFHF